MMFACYRREDAADPETYCAAVAAVLADYSVEVVDYVTDPRTGLPSRQKFLPNIAEISEALRARASDVERARTYSARVAEQTRLTEEWLNGQSSDRLKAKGAAWLDRTDPAAREFGLKPKGPPTAEEKAALLADAEKVAKEINSGELKLSDEARALLKEQDKRYGAEP